jgi:chemotaxis protein CheD
MNHFQLPSVYEQDSATARFGNVATSELIWMMMNEGCKAEHLEAQIFGGAHDPKVSSSDIGSENIKIARKVLAKAHIRVVSEDVGGEKSRKVFFNTVTNEVAVIKSDKLWKIN